MKERADIINLEDVCDVEAGMSPALFQYYTGLSKRRIILNDQIDDGIVERVILPLIDMDNDGTGEPIEIILSSPGGSLYDGFVLADIIDRLKTPTTIIVMGYAFSMGSIILMSGYSNPNVRKVCYPSSTALIHSGSTYLEVITAQQSLLNTELSKIVDDFYKMQAVVNLYYALGGGRD